MKRIVVFGQYRVIQWNRYKVLHFCSGYGVVLELKNMAASL